MRTNFLRLIAIIAFCGCAKPTEQVPKPEVDPKQLEKAAHVPNKHDPLRGTWTCVAFENKGEKYIKAAYDGTKLETASDFWSITSFGVTSKIRVKLNEQADPKEVDLYYLRFEEETPPLRGIFKIEGDEFTLCRAIGNGARPTEFKTTKDGNVMMVFRRDGVNFP